MGIQSIKRDYGITPSIVRILTTDDLATVEAAGYITSQYENILEVNDGQFNWVNTDTALVAASDGWVLASINAQFTSLIPIGGGGSGTVDAGLMNELAWYAANGTVVSGLATADNAVLTTSNAGVPHWLANGTAGFVLTANTGAPPSWQAGATGVTAAQVQELAFNTAADGGILNEYDLVLSPAITSYTDELPLYFTPANTNTSTTPTMQVNALGGHVIVKAGGAVAPGDIVAGTPCFLLYSLTNTNWLLLNPQTVVGASPWTFGTGTDSAIGGDGTAIASGNYSFSYGSTINKVEGNSSGSVGDANTVFGSYSFVAGGSNTQSGNYSAVFGNGNTTSSNYSFTCGLDNINDGAFGFVMGANNELDSSSGSFVGGSHCRNNGSNYTFMWGDNVGTTNYPTADGQFIANSSGGFFIWYGNGTLAAKFLSTGSQIIGTNTNNNAPAGYVGEYVFSQVLQASAITLTTATPADITSISLGAGDWDVSGNAFLSYTGLSTSGIAWINTTSATMPDESVTVGDSSASGSLFNRGLSIFTQRLSLATTTTVYLTASALFTTGSAIASGIINARRVR